MPGGVDTELVLPRRGEHTIKAVGARELSLLAKMVRNDGSCTQVHQRPRCARSACRIDVVKPHLSTFEGCASAGVVDGSRGLDGDDEGRICADVFELREGNSLEVVDAQVEGPTLVREFGDGEPALGVGGCARKKALRGPRAIEGQHLKGLERFLSALVRAVEHDPAGEGGAQRW